MRKLAISMLLGVLALAPGARAKDYPSRGSTAYPAPTLHGELRLSLAEAISMGLENNLGIEIERHAPLIAHEDYEAAWGSYDPIWNAEFGYSDVEDPTANVLLGTFVGEFKTVDGWGGFSGLVPWLGASYDLRYIGSDRRTNSSIQALSPELRSEVSFALTLPLLRNLIWNESWTLVKTTQVLELTAFERFRQNLMDTVTQIEGGYWALIADEERVGVAEKSLETAEALLNRVTTQYEVGVVSRVEIAEADAGVAAREFELIRAQNRYRDRMDRLINLVLGPNLTADSRISIEPTDRPDEYVVYDIDVERAVQIAFRNRPEFVIAQQDIDRLEINLKFAKNQRLPRLDAQLTYGNRGIAGFANPAFDGCRFASPDEFPSCALDPPVPPDPTLGGYGRTFETPGDFFTSDAARQLTARAVVSIPFPNTTARANVSKAQLQLRRAHVQKKRVEQNIILNVRAAARDLKSSQEGIEAAERRQAAATEQLRAEEIRLEYGESTPFDVLLREQDLVAADQEFIAAVEVYRSSVTGLDRAQGTILRNRNINVDQAARLR